MSSKTSIAEPIRPSRRAMVRGAAWTVPVVAVAATAPAYAASPCDPIRRLTSWTNNTQFTRTSATSAEYKIPDPDGTGPGQALTVTITNTFIGSNTQLRDQGSNTSDNLRVVSNIAASGSGLTLHQSPISNSAKVNTYTGTTNKTITKFEFSRPVASLSFAIMDIDSNPSDFWDAIALVGGNFAGTPVSTANVIGNGSTTNPWRAVDSNNVVLDDTNLGNVNVTMSNVSSFEVHYWNITSASSSRIDGNQKTFLSNFDLTYKPC